MKKIVSSLAIALAALAYAGVGGVKAYASHSDDFDEPDPPEVDIPDVPETPDVPEAPDVPETPDIPETPEVEAPEVEAPEVEAPEVEAPEVEAPEVEVEAPEAPETEAPEVEAPEVEAGDNQGGRGSDDSGGGFDDHGGGGSENSGPGGGGGENSGPGGGESENSGPGGGGGENSGSGSENSGPGSGESAGEGPAYAHLIEPMSVERDGEGREYVADEVLMAASAGQIASAEALGYRVIQSVDLAGDQQMARLLVPASHSVPQGIAELQGIAPDAIVTINNAYRRTQAVARRTRASPPSRRAGGGGLVGVIDTGANPSAAPGALADMRGFGSAGYSPGEHGSAVVSIVTRLGARAQVADVFGPSRAGEPYAAASSIIAALRWMVETGVPVVNLSIEGPRNPILERAIANAAQSGHVVVAAAGNGGPLAPPAFPGAYAGVVAITAVDANGRAYIRANRGDYVDFAALGVAVPVDTGDARLSVTGTSFAAPFVAARIAEQMHQPSAEDAQASIAALRDSAIDRGAPGRDPIYGWGEIPQD